MGEHTGEGCGLGGARGRGGAKNGRQRAGGKEGARWIGEEAKTDGLSVHLAGERAFRAGMKGRETVHSTINDNNISYYRLTCTLCHLYAQIITHSLLLIIRNL